MRHFPGWLWPLIVGLFLGLIANLDARAETVPKTSVKYFLDNNGFVSGGLIKPKPLSGQELCTALVTWYGGPQTYSGTATGGTCMPVNIGVSTATYMGCPSGFTDNGAGACSRPDCVAPQTRDSLTGICVVPCGADQYRQDGVCKCTNGSQTGTNGSCCPAPGSGGGAAMQWCYVSGPNASSCDSSGANGCAVRCNNVTFQKGTGDQVNIYPKQALGQGCGYTGLKTAADSPGGGEMTNEQLKEVSEATKDPAKAKSPEGCLGAGMGYIHTVPHNSFSIVNRLHMLHSLDEIPQTLHA